MDENSQDRERLRSLAEYLAIVEFKDFCAGEMVNPIGAPNGVIRLPFVDFSETARQFLAGLNNDQVDAFSQAVNFFRRLFKS